VVKSRNPENYRLRDPTNSKLTDPISPILSDPIGPSFTQSDVDNDDLTSYSLDSNDPSDSLNSPILIDDLNSHILIDGDEDFGFMLLNDGSNSPIPSDDNSTSSISSGRTSSKKNSSLASTIFGPIKKMILVRKKDPTILAIN
jgi:hypothetical protein